MDLTLDLVEDNPFVLFIEQYQKDDSHWASLSGYCRQYLLHPTLLLFLLWHGKFVGGRLSKQVLQEMLSNLQHWHYQVKEGLERLKHNVALLGDDYAHLLHDIEQEQQVAEQLECQMLYQHVFDELTPNQSFSPKLKSALRNSLINLNSYFALLKMHKPPDQVTLARLVQSVLDSESLETIMAALQKTPGALVSKEAGKLDQLHLTFDQ